MNSRRKFLTKSALASAAIATTPFNGFAKEISNINYNSQPQGLPKNNLNFPAKYGMGGVALGNGFHENSNVQITETLEVAWQSGVRYFDTSPFYGFGLSERRLGQFLFEKRRDEFLLSTKVGRLLQPSDDFTPNPDLLWKGRLNFKYEYDYTASGVRKSIEDSLQRLGLSSIDIVYVHDLSPDNGDFGSSWTEQFDIAKKGAFPELTKMREEGIIKAWGLGVNTPKPIIKCLEVADPDVMLVAIQYSLVEHENALNSLFPIMDKHNVKAVIGGPLNAGFLANRDRFNYGGGPLPKNLVDKRNKIKSIIKHYNIDLATVALNFCASNPTVASVIPGASQPKQVQANINSFNKKMPSDLWAELKAEKLIAANAPM